MMDWAHRFADAYAGADDTVRALGAQWYPDVFKWCRGIASGRSTAHRVAGALAAVSPRIRWKHALLDVEHAVRGDGQRYALNGRRMVADRILRGEVRPLDALTGPKTNAFYRNICGDPNAVTLDVHMLRVAGLDGPAITRARYVMMAGALREAAAYHAVEPRALQAAVWIAQRGAP